MIELRRINTHFDIARGERFHAAVERDAALVNEHHIGQDVLDLFGMMGGDHDGAIPVVVIVDQRVVELLAEQDVKTECRLIKHQQLRFNGHHQRQMQLRDHAFRQRADRAFALDHGLRKKALGAGTVKSRMHARHIIERLTHAQPTRQHGHVGDKAHVLHQQVALGPRVATQHFEITLKRCQTEHRFKRTRLACAVGANQPDDASPLNSQVDAFHRYVLAVSLGQAAGFDACHC